MPSSNSHTVRGALKSAGVELVRSVQLPSGIVMSEWTGQNTLTEYQNSTENVLSVYLSGGENCSLVRERKVVHRGFKGAICLFPMENSRSQWQITDRLHFLHFYFDPRNFEESLTHSLRNPPGSYRFRQVFQESCTVISAAAVSLAQADWNDKSLSLGVDGLMSWIFLNAIRTYSTMNLEPVDMRGRFSKTQADAISDYLRENLGEPVRLEGLARLANLSRYHFLRKFKNTFGSSPHVYLTRLRMSRAHDLLQKSNQKITTVAFECGYSQHSQFTMAFKRYFGYSPSAVRAD